MNAYEQKRQARIDRLHARAERLGEAAQSTVDAARRMADVIPFGQPILVGHHSEGRDRRYRGRIDAKFRKGFELAAEARDAAGRAAAAEANTAISSDDPDAAAKLREKLTGLRSDIARMKLVNKMLREGQSDDAIAEAARLTPGAVAELRKPDFCGRTGFADYQLRNAGAEARRLEKRILGLEAKAEAPAREPLIIGEVTISEADNRVRIVFPGKPADAVRAELKASGFRWAPTEGAWQRHASNGAWYHAERIVRSAS